VEGGRVNDKTYNNVLHQFHILPHPSELVKNIPAKFHVFVNGNYFGYLLNTHKSGKIKK